MNFIIYRLFNEALTGVDLSDDKRKEISRMEDRFKRWNTAKKQQLKNSERSIDNRVQTLLRNKTLSPEDRQRIIRNGQTRKTELIGRANSDIANRKTDIDSEKIKWQQNMKTKRQQLTKAIRKGPTSPTLGV